MKENALEKVEVPSSVEPKVMARLTRDQLRAYGHAALDPNPIHFDEVIAKSMGLPGVIAHGMLVSALMIERVQQVMESELQNHYFLKSWSTRFRSMSFPEEAIRVYGKIKTESNSAVILDLKAENEAGEVKATGQAVLNTI